MTKFAVIDLANLFSRAQHVTRGDAFTKAGMAVHIVFKSLRKLRREMQVDHMVFCAEGRSWRYDAYPLYKRKRRVERMNKSEAEKEEDEVFFSVLNDLINYIGEKTNCTLLQSEGIEGDDFVGRWIQLHPNDEHVLLSGDSDFIQLLAPNVTIVDGVNERVIRTDGVSDFKGEAFTFKVDSSSGRLKVGDTVEEARKKHDKAERERKKACVEAGEPYVKIPYEFTPEPEWWKKALFVKIVRGDSGDGILSAYPRVRYEGTKKQIGICEAWEDRRDQGYNWTNFMNQTWKKPVDTTDGIKDVDVLVKDEFAVNESLIDLSMQPSEVIDLMDAVIIQAVQKTRVPNVGILFMQFCRQQALDALAREATDHAAYLNRPYTLQ